MNFATPDPRLGCSSISFRHRGLAEALGLISDLGFGETDLGALPGVCDHVPTPLTDAAVPALAEQVERSGLRVRSINADIGDLNEPIGADAQRARDEHLGRLLDLAEAVHAQAVVLPCGRQDREPFVNLGADLDLVAGQLHRAADQARARDVEVWVEALHSLRLCDDASTATALVTRLDPGRVGVVYDVSHVVAVKADPLEYLKAVGEHVVHVHLRDAAPGDIHRSIGNGDVDFARLITALAAQGYAGPYTLELETRDVDEHDRPAATARAGSAITALLRAHPPAPSSPAGSALEEGNHHV